MKKLLAALILIAFASTVNAQDKVPSVDNRIFDKYESDVLQLFCPVYTNKRVKPMERFTIIHRNKPVSLSMNRAVARYKANPNRFSKNVFWMSKKSPMSAEDLNKVIEKADKDKKIKNINDYFDLINNSLKEAKEKVKKTEVVKEKAK